MSTTEIEHQEKRRAARHSIYVLFALVVITYASIFTTVALVYAALRMGS